VPHRYTRGIGFSIYMIVSIFTAFTVFSIVFYSEPVQLKGQSKTVEFTPRKVVRPDRENILSSISRSQERKDPPKKEVKKEKPKPEPEPKPEPSYNYGIEPIPYDALPYLMQVINDHESGGNYKAYNPTGCSDKNGTFSCGGRWQLSEQYASGWAAAAGFPGQSSHAETWAPAIQDAVALDLYKKTGGSLWCNYTSYC